MKVLVTGGAGAIGSNLVSRLYREGHDVYVVDNLWRGKISNLTNVFRGDTELTRRFLDLDLRDKENCRRACIGIDAVFHLADIVAGIDFVFNNELFVFQSNILINSNMLSAAVECGVSKFVYVGTACSYPAELQAKIGGPRLVESDVYPANPESSYGWSKLMGEYECGLAQSEGKIGVGIVRLHNVYGPPCELSPKKSQVIPALCRKAIRFPNEPFRVWGGGAQRRAFVYMEDAVEGILACFHRGINQGAIQLGPERSCSISEIAEKIVKLSGKNIEILFDSDMPEGDQDRAADNTRAREILKWTPSVDIDTGLAQTFAWVKEYGLGKSNLEST